MYMDALSWQNTEVVCLCLPPVFSFGLSPLFPISRLLRPVGETAGLLLGPPEPARVHIYIYIYIYIYTYMMYIYILLYIHVYIYMYIHAESETVTETCL